MCPVRNMMWMGTSAGAIKVFHAPTLKTKFTCMLETEGPDGTTSRTILDILYVEEVRTVLVSNFSGEVWSFHDTLVEDGLRLQCKIELNDGFPCYHLVKVSKWENRDFCCLYFTSLFYLVPPPFSLSPPPPLSLPLSHSPAFSCFPALLLSLLFPVLCTSSPPCSPPLFLWPLSPPPPPQSLSLTSP